jgi:putative membrane protein
MWYHVGWGWGWGVMTLVMVAFWGLVIWAVVNVVRGAGEAAPTRQRRPEGILAERLARGDIDEDEYRVRLAALRARPDSDVEDRVDAR